MIPIEFSLAIASFLSIGIGLVFLLWIFYNYNEDSMLHKDSEFTQCPYCGYIFFCVKTQELILCPRCKSYLDQPPNDNPDQENITETKSKDT